MCVIFTVWGVEVCACLYMFDSASHSQAPLPLISVFVSPRASWLTDVCYPTPSELAQCDSHCRRGREGTMDRHACLCVPQGMLEHGGVWGQYGTHARPQKRYLAFLSSGADSTKAWSMRKDKRCLWSSGTDRLPDLTQSKRGDEWVCQAKHTASKGICMSA